MKIDVSDLRKAFEVLILHLEETNQRTFEIDADFYWDVPEEGRYDSYVEPKELNLGQLTDDWQELLKIANGDMPPVGPALVWFSSVLRSVGEATKL